MKIKVFDIDYDISREDIYDSADYILDKRDIVFATEDLTRIDIDYSIIDDTYNKTIVVIFNHLDDDMIYCYNINDFNSAEGIVSCSLEFKQPFFGPDGYCHDFADNLPEQMIFNISDEEAEDICFDELIADLISNETDYLVQGFDWEEIEE